MTKVGESLNANQLVQEKIMVGYQFDVLEQGKSTTETKAEQMAESEW